MQPHQADGLLGAGETVDVPLSICLRNMLRFDFFVDVLGIEVSDIANLLAQR